MHYGAAAEISVITSLSVTYVVYGKEGDGYNGANSGYVLNMVLV